MGDGKDTDTNAVNSRKPNLGCTAPAGYYSETSIDKVSTLSADKHIFSSTSSEAPGERSKRVSASSSDIETEPEGKRNGTTTPQSELPSDGKVTTLLAYKQVADA